MKSIVIKENEILEITDRNGNHLGRLAINGDGSIFLEEAYSPGITVSVGWGNVVSFKNDITDIVKHYDGQAHDMVLEQIDITELL